MSSICPFVPSACLIVMSVRSSSSQLRSHQTIPYVGGYQCSRQQHDSNTNGDAFVVEPPAKIAASNVLSLHSPPRCYTRHWSRSDDSGQSAINTRQVDDISCAASRFLLKSRNTPNGSLLTAHSGFDLPICAGDRLWSTLIAGHWEIPTRGMSSRNAFHLTLIFEAGQPYRSKSHCRDENFCGVSQSWKKLRKMGKVHHTKDIEYRGVGQSKAASVVHDIPQPDKVLSRAGQTDVISHGSTVPASALSHTLHITARCRVLLTV